MIRSISYRTLGIMPYQLCPSMIQSRSVRTKTSSRVGRQVRSKPSNTQSKPTNEIPKFQFDNIDHLQLVCIDFEAVQSNVCEFPAISLTKSSLGSIFFSYVQAPRLSTFFQGFLRKEPNFYREFPPFNQVEAHFIQWGIEQKLFQISCK